MTKFILRPAEWSERLTPGQPSWLRDAAVGSIAALALSLSSTSIFSSRSSTSLYFNVVFAVSVFKAVGKVSSSALLKLFPEFVFLFQLDCVSNIISPTEVKVS